MATIDPVAFQLGPFAVRWYGIIIACSVLLGLFLTLREARRKGVDTDFIYDLAIVLIPIGIIGTRLFFVLGHWEYYVDNPRSIFFTWEGGLAIHGGIAAGLLSGYIMCRIRRQPFWKIADLVAPPLVLAQALGRFGNFINQEAYGFATDVPWAVYMHGAYRHPTFFYESAWNILVFVFLLWYRRRNEISGRIFWAYLGLYSVGRLVIQHFRVDTTYWGPISVAQAGSVLLILGAMFFFWKTSAKQWAE